MLKLREIRTARGYTQKQIADMIGVSSVSLSNYERGAQMPDLEVLKRIADVLCVTTDELLGYNANVNETDEVWAFREQMKNNPSYRLLFRAADKAKPEALRAATAVLHSLKGDTNAD